MPKITGHDVTYAGNEGIVRDARDELYEVNPVREDATVEDVNTDAQREAQERENAAADERGRRDQQSSAAVQDQAEAMRDGQDDKGGASASDGNSSKASSAQHGRTTPRK